jgi:hypothetical protein
MPRYRLHDPMKHVIRQDIMFHNRFYTGLKIMPVQHWWNRARKFLGL